MYKRTLLLVGIVFLGNTHFASAQKSIASKAREIIKNAKADEELPEGVSVRIWADMGGGEKEKH